MVIGDRISTIFSRATFRPRATVRLPSDYPNRMEDSSSFCVQGRGGVWAREKGTVIGKPYLLDNCMFRMFEYISNINKTTIFKFCSNTYIIAWCPTYKTVTLLLVLVLYSTV